MGLQKRYQVFDGVYYVTAGKFRRYHGESILAQVIDIRTWLLNIRDFFRVLSGIVSARRYLKKIKPLVVFSKGSFVAVPVGIAARLLNIPIVTHDSDAVPGLANRIVGRWAVAHATGMPTEHYKYSRETVHYVGVPVDERVKPMSKHLQVDYKKQIGVQPSDCVLLVGGAGLGARNLNNLTLQIAPKLLRELANLHIVHITGATHQAEVATKYESLLSPSEQQRVKVIGFTDNFYIYTGAADLIFTRAGATTIAELAAQHKACILMPAPHLPGGHQLKNAQILKKIGAVEVASNDIQGEQLFKTVISLLQDHQKRETLAENLGKVAQPEAASKLAELLLNVAAQKASA